VKVLHTLVGDDPKTVTRFLTGYRVALRKATQDMGTARNNKDMQQVAAVAHKLKSSSQSVGAMALGNLCAALDNACQAGDFDLVMRHLDDFQAATAEVDEHLAQVLPPA
jgi:HPt (histidine-containing phosphotransfer) domain-containing protein